MMFKDNPSYGHIPPKEEAFTSPKEGRESISKANAEVYWRLPDDVSYTVDPRHCFERTVQATAFEFHGAAKSDSNTAIFFSVPVYYKEWEQGTLLKMCERFFAQAETQHIPIEINFLVNLATLGYRERDFEWYQKSQEFLDKFRQSDGEYDFSQLTHEEYLIYRELEYGSFISFETALKKDFGNHAGEVYEANQAMVRFMTDLVEAQRLKKASSGRFNSIRQRFLGYRPLEKVISKYTYEPQKQALIRLAYQYADKVQISFFDLLKADTMAEGYGRNGIATVRCIGGDYVRQRRRGLKQRCIYLPWDIDMLPSSNFIDDLVAYYQRHPEIMVASLQTAGLPSPGTNRTLFETSLQFNLQWTGNNEPFSILSTPNISMSDEALESLNGITGDPINNPHRDEDRKTGWRLIRWLSNNPTLRESHNRPQLDFPSVTSFMLDREGYEDGSGRSTGKKATEQLGKKPLILYLAHEQTLPLSQDLNDPAYEALKNDSLFTRAYQQYTAECLAFSRINRLTVRTFIRNMRSGNIRFVDDRIVADYKKIAFLSSPLEDYLQRNQEFLLSLTQEDWDYILFLVGESSFCPIVELTATQEVLREYLGQPVSFEDALSLIFQHQDTRSANDTRSLYFGTIAYKLAKSLWMRNTKSNTINPNETGVEMHPVMAAYKERGKSITEAVKKGGW